MLIPYFTYCIFSCHLLLFQTTINKYRYFIIPVQYINFFNLHKIFPSNPKYYLYMHLFFGNSILTFPLFFSSVKSFFPVWQLQTEMLVLIACSKQLIPNHKYLTVTHTLHTSIHERYDEYFSSSAIVSSIALLLLPQAGKTVSNLFREISR